MSTIRGSQLSRSHSESGGKLLQGDAAVDRARQANYRPRRHSSKQKQVTSSPQQKWQPTRNSKISNLAHEHQKTSHSQPDMQRIGFESESPKKPRAISFQSKLKWQQKLHNEQNFRDRADITHCHNTPEHPKKRHSRVYMWPSLLHRPPIGDIFYKQNPWEQQDATTSDEENFTSQKSLSQSSISNYKMFATSHITHQESDHWTISNTEIKDRVLRNEFPDVNG